MLVLGSFTGIRIGVSSAKAIAESLQIPIIDVSSLEALAYNVQCNHSNIICSLIDAKNNQVYCGLFDEHYNLLQDYMADDINTILHKLAKHKHILFVGNGAIAHKDLLGISNFAYDNTIHAAKIAQCAFNKYKNNKIQSADSLVPLYLRKSQAERMKQFNEK